ILGYTPKFLLHEVEEHNLIQTISTIEEALALDSSGAAKVHIKINTGMNRLGISADNIDEIAAIYRLKNIQVTGIYTNLYSSDEVAPTLVQFEKFGQILRGLEARGIKAGIRHVCNSGGIIAFRQMHLDMVREGIMLYGLYPSKKISRSTVNLKECMELRSFIARIMNVKKGDGISYGHDFIAPIDMKIAAVSLGYSDGVFRNLGNKGEVIIHDRRRPIVGRVCMNMFMVDITGMDDVEVEDEVIVFGRSENQFISIEEVAEWAGTISYEVICRTGCSAPRVYFKNGRMIGCEQESLIEKNGNKHI
ncbi:MAG: alanine racemase, partial [Clostridia bacterium]